MRSLRIDRWPDRAVATEHDTRHAPRIRANDEEFMRRALACAERAAALDEVPVGAVVVLHGVVIGEGANCPISARDPTAHAEIVAMRNAAAHVGNYRLSGATLYVTIEPCTMCAGALIHARIATLVFGAREPRAGAIVSTARVLDNAGLNHRVDAIEGVLADDCARRLTEFFRTRRGGGEGSRIIPPDHPRDSR